MRLEQPKTAMILAAGRGTRLGELGRKKAKSLLELDGKPLIQHHIEKLRGAGFEKIVINVSHLAKQIKEFLSSTEDWKIELSFSEEPEPLETAGGIAFALDQINSDIFPVINADVFTTFEYEVFNAVIRQLNDQKTLSSFLYLVPNPTHHPKGDFALDRDAVTLTGTDKKTFSGLGIYRRALFENLKRGNSYPLAPILHTEIAAGRTAGAQLKGFWSDVGTLDRYRRAEEFLSNQ